MRIVRHNDKCLVNEMALICYGDTNEYLAQSLKTRLPEQAAAGHLPAQRGMRQARPVGVAPLPAPSGRLAMAREPTKAELYDRCHLMGDIIVDGLSKPALEVAK